MDEIRSRIARGDIKLERAQAAKVFYVLCTLHDRQILMTKAGHVRDRCQSRPKANCSNIIPRFNDVGVYCACP